MILSDALFTGLDDTSQTASGYVVGLGEHVDVVGGHLGALRASGICGGGIRRGTVYPTNPRYKRDARPVQPRAQLASR